MLSLRIRKQIHATWSNIFHYSMKSLRSWDKKIIYSSFFSCTYIWWRNRKILFLAWSFLNLDNIYWYFLCSLERISKLFKKSWQLPWDGLVWFKSTWKFWWILHSYGNTSYDFPAIYYFLLKRHSRILMIQKQSPRGVL